MRRATHDQVTMDDMAIRELEQREEEVQQPVREVSKLKKRIQSFMNLPLFALLTMGVRGSAHSRCDPQE